MADVNKILALYGELKMRSDNVASHRQQIANVMLPRREGFNGEDSPDGNRLQDEIYDSTPQQAARGLGSALGTMLRPEGQKWFFIRGEDPVLNDTDEAAAWFEEAETRMIRRAFDNPKSRFRQAMGEADVDLVVFGENTVFAGLNELKNGMHYQTQHLKDIFKIVNADGNVDGLIRKKMMTARQARQFFGKDAKKASVVVEAEQSEKVSNDKHEFIHVVMPRADGKMSGFSVQLPYSSIWIEVSKKDLISESGFEEFPYIVGRFDTTAGEDHGRGPGMVALPDANMLQAMDESILIAAQKAVEPPLLAPDDGSFNAGNTYPGGISYFDAELAKEMGRMPISTLDHNSRIDIGLEMQQDRREQVRNAFFKNVLALPVDGPQMTATEVIARNQEFLRELGGVFGRLESDYIAPIVERTFNVMLRNGGLPEIPEILQGQNIRFEYESPIKKTRQQVEAASARQWKDDLLLLAQIDPGALDVLNAEEYARFQADANAVPLKIQNNDEQVAQIRAQREAEQLAAKQMQEGLALAEGGEKATKAISNLQGAA